MSEGLPAATDCIIIGGGVIGCSLAYHLARDGRAPLVIERGAVGAGTTARCAGGLRRSSDAGARR